MNIVIDLWIGIVVFVWGILLRGAWTWGRDFHLPMSPTASDQTVRVCVPARNEVDNIRPCVESILASVGVELELFVADDGSTDGTAMVAVSASRGDDRFHIVDPDERPTDWAGKSWACQAAAQGADTDWLLFIDADVRVSPHAIASAVTRGTRNEADLLSLLGTWELQTFWEQVAIPAIGWFIRGFASPEDVNAGRRAFANGQFILVRRSSYDDIGGHAAVKGEVLDDVRLAEAARAAGQRLWLLWAPAAFRVRLYDSLPAIADGYRKNLFEGAGRQPLLPLFGALSTALTAVLPPLMIPVFALLDMPMRTGWMVLVTLLMVAWRYIVEVRDGRSGAAALTHPLGAAVLVAVLVSSALTREVSWKGRKFIGGKAV